MFRVSVAVPHAAPMRVHAIVNSKVRYLSQEIWSDLQLQHSSTGDFWFSVLLYLMALWARMYIHFLGQWVYLKALSVPLFGFEMQVYMIEFKYVFTSMTTGVEIGVVMMGPLSCIAVLGFLCLVGSTILASIGHMPDWLSKFSAAFAVGAILDPLLVLAIDVLASNYKCTTHSEACAADYTDSSCHCVEGDAFKLWTRLEDEDSGGVMGLLYTAIIYAGLMIIATAGAYGYFIWVHMNGRMLDVYMRVHSPEESFFVPHDFEVTQAELAHVCILAKRWTGKAGEQMAVEVNEYDTASAHDPKGGSAGVSTHISIQTVMIDGKRCLWRHFLRTPDGALVEVVGDASKKLADTFGISAASLAPNRTVGPGADFNRAASASSVFAGQPAPEEETKHQGDEGDAAQGHFKSLSLLA